MLGALQGPSVRAAPLGRASVLASVVRAGQPCKMERRLQDVEAVVVGAGPNGLAAALDLAAAGLKTVVLERGDRVGGSCRSAELTLPGIIHDVCAAIMPMAVASSRLRDLDLGRYGLEWITPPLALAHPFDDGTAAVMAISLDETAASLDWVDAKAYSKLMAPIVRSWSALASDVLTPWHFPRHPWVLGRFGMRALLPATTLAHLVFRGSRARALLGGLAAHSVLPLSAWASSSFGLLLGAMAHTTGWPLVRGGSQMVVDAMAACLRDRGGSIHLGTPVTSLDELGEARLVLLDVTPRQLVKISGRHLGALTRWRLGRFRYGPGVFKVDWALSGPIPWRAEICGRAGTVHLGGSFEEIAQAEAAVAKGRHADKPFVLLAQPSRFDPSRTGDARHTAWAYCHVPNGSTADLMTAVEAQVERFAPGFRDCILARHTRTAAQAESENPNRLGGDITGGLNSLGQLFTRPLARLVPYATGIPGVFLCSASTPPGGGVHGFCGFNAADAALVALRRGSVRMR